MTRDEAPRSLAHQKQRLPHGRDPIRVQPTSVVRAIDRGRWWAPLGSSRGQAPNRWQPAWRPSRTSLRRMKNALLHRRCAPGRWRRASNKRMKLASCTLDEECPYKSDGRIAPVWKCTGGASAALEPPVKGLLDRDEVKIGPLCGNRHTKTAETTALSFIDVQATMRRHRNCAKTQDTSTRSKELQN
jgi:hypothetical protein